MSYNIQEIEKIASQDAGMPLHKGCSPYLQTEDGISSRYNFDWFTVKVLWNNTEINSINGEVKTGCDYEELQLRSPDGRILARCEARKISYSLGNYPVGDYRNTIPCELDP